MTAKLENSSSLQSRLEVKIIRVGQDREIGGVVVLGEVHVFSVLVLVQELGTVVFGQRYAEICTIQK